MQVSMLRLTRKLVDISGKIVLQVVVSVAATVCVATITNAYLKGDAPAGDMASRLAAALESRAAASLLNANFTADAFRSRVASPVEFAAVFGPGEGGIAASAAGKEWPKAEARAEERPVQKVRQAGLSACPDECERPHVAAVLPPARPQAETAAQVVQASAAGEKAEAKQLHLLGLPLPGFVPSGEKIMTAMASLGDSITGLVLK